MKREVEVKFELLDIENTIDKLDKMLGVSLPVFQHDSVYIKNLSNSVEEYLANTEFPRIRISENGALFSYKKNSNRGEDIQDKLEIEFMVSDPLSCHNFLVEMGLNKQLEVKKTRRKYKYKDYELCVDSVEDLGNYIEIEKLLEHDDNSNFVDIEKELVDIIHGLDIEIGSKVSRGYDTLKLIKSLGI
ncbi:class IV adenylate cyclase [Candidatus Nomurabacteria bacterium]|nr:class IV adenylate cyclase [Candidatus Nomurabacteria bacterium]